MESFLVLSRSSSDDSNSIDRKSTSAPHLLPPFASIPASRVGEDALLKAALDGDLAGLKGIIKSLGIGDGDGAAVFSINKDDFGVLHCAARWGHLEVCKYLVEELGGDVNMPAAEGVTPFMASVEYDDISIVNYLLDHGGDPMKADIMGRTVLHHAVVTGSCKPNTTLIGVGTPLMVALLHRSLDCMKLLIEAGADVNGKGSIVSPLLIATQQGGYTDFIRFLLEAGADPNICDDLGRLPIELAALYDCRAEVEMLFPLTSPLPNVQNWSIDGLISHAKLNNAKPMVEGRKAILKLEAGKAFRRKDYGMALAFYDSAIKLAPDATLYSNRSLCKAQMGDGEGALLDAQQCRTMRPDWAKAYYRMAAAHIVLEDYEQAAEAVLEAEDLDPETEDIEIEIRKIMEAMTICPDEDVDDMSSDDDVDDLSSDEDEV